LRAHERNRLKQRQNNNRHRFKAANYFQLMHILELKLNLRM